MDQTAKTFGEAFDRALHFMHECARFSRRSEVTRQRLARIDKPLAQNTNPLAQTPLMLCPPCGTRPAAAAPAHRIIALDASVWLGQFKTGAGKTTAAAVPAPARKKYIDPARGQRLAEIRRARDLSIRQMVKPGMSRGAIQNYEHGRTRVPDDQIAKLAEILDVEPGDLFAAPGTPVPPRHRKSR